MRRIHPINYKIALEPDLKRFDFSGTVEILIEASEPVTDVTLDALELTISGCEVGTLNGLDACPFDVDPQKHKRTLSLPRKMAGRILLRIRYAGFINDKMAGFYRSQVRVRGKTRTIGVTQFEESDARRAFPCFDRPCPRRRKDVGCATTSSTFKLTPQFRRDVPRCK